VKNNRNANNRDLRVKSWSELNEALYEDAWKPQLGRFRSDFAFRGLSNADGDLSTSLSRLGGDSSSIEGHLLRNFRKYAQMRGAVNDSVWHWLALGQHHGLPTRLLDWTYSPFVALHFVTNNLETYDNDGVIWCVDYVRANRRLPSVLRRVLEREGSNVFTVEMLNDAAPSLAKFDSLAAEPFVVFIEPPSLDQRIINQYALFSLMSGGPDSRLDYWLREHPDLVRRVIVPAKLKWEIRDKLDQANITERVLLPGLDGLSLWLTRHYSPAQRTENSASSSDNDALSPRQAHHLANDNLRPQLVKRNHRSRSRRKPA
jgi:FRG domain-containing protein